MMLLTVAASVFLLLGNELQKVSCLQLLRVDVPTQRQKGDSAILFCRFDLHGDALYSVKWYKGGKEFFRYVPKDSPPVQTFPVDGINVNTSLSSHQQVVIDNINLQTGGRFKCEVSAEAPSFQTVYGYGEMSVIALPTGPPEISGAKSTYQSGELLVANCTSPKSKPLANLTWLLNGQKVPEKYLKEYKLVHDAEGLEWTTLGLFFHVTEAHFENGKLHLTCTASISALQWQAQQNASNADVLTQDLFPRQRTLASRPAASTTGGGGAIFTTDTRVWLSVVLILLYLAPLNSF